jgi:hypothetical protein
MHLEFVNNELLGHKKVAKILLETIEIIAKM